MAISDIVLRYIINEAYHPDKTWENYGQKIMGRMKEEGIGRTGKGETPWVGEHYKTKLSEKINQHDPTPHKEYGVWLASRYASGGISRLEDFGRAQNALIKFHEAKSRKQLGVHGLSSDIGQYKRLADLEDAVGKLPKEAYSEDEEKLAHEKARAETEHHEDENWKIKIPKTEHASRFYGRGTRWCTAADKNCMFNDYNEQGPLHIFIPKNPRHPGEKYQLHMESGQFMDENDDPADFKNVFG